MRQRNATSALNNRHLVTVLMCGTALSPLGAAAQETAIQPTVLAPIVVTVQADDSSTVVANNVSMGGKISTDILDTAASISIVTSKELRQRGVTNTEQALAYSPGIVTGFYGSDNRWDFFKIRGFDATTYRDGLRLGGSGQSAGNLREDIYAYERVEILKGADTTLFGAADPGGMVNYVSKTPKTERFGEVYGRVGSFSHKEVGVDFGDVLNADGSLAYRFTARVQDADGEEDFSRDDGKLIMGSVAWRPTDATTITAVVDVLNSDGNTSAGLPLGTDFDRSYFLGEPDFNYVGNDRSSISLMVEHDFGGGLSFAANSRYEDFQTDFGFLFLGTTPTDGSTVIGRSFFASDTDGHRFNTDARLKYDAVFGSVESSTTVGAQYAQTAYTSLGWYTGAPSIDWTNPVYTGGLDLRATAPYQNIYRSEDTKALYAQQVFTFSERLIASVGVRHDWTDVEQTNRFDNTLTEGDYSETTARLGLTYKITPEVSAYASYAESVVPGSVQTVDPERGEQYEVGVKYRPQGMNALFSAAWFDLSKTNITRVDANFQEYLLPEVNSKGIELEARAEVLDGLELIAAYSYTDTETRMNGAAETTRLAKVPEHLASLWANYTLAGNGARGDMTFGLGARYTGSYFNNDQNTGRKSGAETIYDAAVSYEVADNTAVELNVTNLFDTKYDTGGTALYYNPGREISATIRRTW